MEKSEQVFASLRDRFFALLIDLAVFCIVFFPITKMAKGVWLMATSDHLWQLGWMISDPLFIIFFIGMLAYYVVLEGYFGRTIGKLIMRIKVIAKEGGVPGFNKSVQRNLLRLVDGLPALNILGVVMILVTRERTRVGDLVAGTRVIRTAGYRD